MELLNISQTASFLANHNDFLIISHANPDADTIGSASALAQGLRQIGKRAFCMCADPVPDKLHFIDPMGVFVTEEPENIATYVSVDTASPNMLGGFADVYDFDLSIDHHLTNTLPCRNKLLIDHYSSCSEIIFEVLEAMQVTLDQHIATALYAGMSSDSGGFRFSSTRPETMRQAAELMATGIDFAKINRRLFETKTIPQLMLEKAALESLSLHHDGKLAITIITPEIWAASGAAETDTDGVSQLPRQIAGVEVSVLIRPRDGKTRGSFRSNEYFDVAELAKNLFDGGGHKHAAGFRTDHSAEEAKQIIIDSLSGKL